MVSTPSKVQIVAYTACDKMEGCTPTLIDGGAVSRRKGRVPDDVRRHTVATNS
jgi:hypothetical protein